MENFSRMAVQQQRSRNKCYENNTFMWLYSVAGSEQMQCSSFFSFCGYYCFLFSKPATRKNGIYHLVIYLKGIPAPHNKNISFSYVIYSADIARKDYFCKRGNMQISEEYFEVIIFESDLEEPLNPGSVTVCFSWCEDEYCRFLQKNVSQNPGTTDSSVECATQTEDNQFPFKINTNSNIDKSTNTESYTQTESASPSYEGDVSSNKDGGSYKFLEILSNEFGRFYESKTDPDCVLKVGEAKFQVHRSILAARSTVFEAMFHHDTAESQSGEVDIQDVDADTLGDVLYYIYTGKIRGLSADMATSMYVTANKYALIDFRDECLDFLMCNLTVENVCDAAILAHTHAELKLEDKVIEFVKERLDDLEDNERWKTFADTHCKIANKLLFSALMSSKKNKTK